MKKGIKIWMAAAVAAILCISAAGCGLLKEAVKRNREGKEQCTVNEEDASRFYMGNKEYTILEDTLGRDQLGDWIGYIQKYVYLNDQNQVVLEKEIEENLTNMADLGKELPENSDCMVTFLNVFQLKDSQTEDDVVIDVGNGFHKAVTHPDDEQKSRIISFERIEAEGADDWKVNSRNCRALLRENQIYEITDIQVPEASDGKYLGNSGEHYIFDNNTGRAIPRADLMEIETVPGRLSRQQRMDWYYGGIYSLPGVEEEEAVAVKINDQFLKAVIKKEQ